MKTAQEVRNEIELERRNQRWKEIYHSYYLLKFYMQHCFPSFDKELGKAIEQKIVSLSKDKKQMSPFSVSVQYYPFPDTLFSTSKEKDQLLEHIRLSGVLQYELFELKRNHFTRQQFYDKSIAYHNHILFRPLFEFITKHGYHVTDFTATRHLGEGKLQSGHSLQKYHIDFTINL